MKVLAVRKVKEVQIQLDEVLDLERWETSSDLQLFLKCGEILEVKYIDCHFDDTVVYNYSIKYLELGE